MTDTPPPASSPVAPPPGEPGWGAPQAAPAYVPPGSALPAIPAEGSRGPAVLGVLALVGAGVEVLVLLVVKLTAAGLSGVNWDTTVVGNVLGGLGIAAIFWIVGVLVVGHLGARAGVTRGRSLALVALGVGYLVLLLWLAVLIVTTLVSALSADWSQWVGGFFWWA